MLSRIPILPLVAGILQRPQYIPTALSALWRKHVGVRKDLKRIDGRALKPPRQISLRITNRCNQRCAICGQFGEKGYMRVHGHQEFLDELPLDVYKGLVDEMMPHRPVFYITGGEAFLYKDLMGLTEYIKQKNGTVYVITNGTLLYQHAQTIVDQNWDMLTASLDGPESVHDVCRGITGTFRKTVDGIHAVLTERRRKKRKTPYLLLSATVSEKNQDKMDDLFDAVSEIQPDCLILYLSWFTTEQAGQRHAAVLKRELGVEAVTWQSYIGQNQNINGARLAEKIRELRSKKFPFAWFHIPSIPLAQVPAYYQEPENFLEYGPCVAPYLMVDIMPNGDVTTCRDYVDVKVGNITEKPLLDIWNDDPFRRFRMMLRKHGGVLPQCSRCCGLMGF